MEVLNASTTQLRLWSAQFVFKRVTPQLTVTAN